jgi:hypothetical protein
MPSSAGTKVTKDPEATRNPVQEGTGVVTSDSLAAESVKAGGSFGGGNAPVSDQPSRSTTTNTTDTSAARKLAPAPDAKAREATEEEDASALLDTGRGLGKAAGRGPTTNLPDSSARQQTGGSSATGDAPNASAAPSAYSADQLLQGAMKPKGKNIKEGGFDADEAPNASFNDDIGGENDPGRAAESRFQRLANESGPEAGSGPRQKGISGDGQYDVLREEQA